MATNSLDKNFVWQRVMYARPRVTFKFILPEGFCAAEMMIFATTAWPQSQLTADLRGGETPCHSCYAAVMDSSE